ncbi:Transcription initiation factor IIB [Entomortierella beljakovae]|nr:Transcription initiation factor IIB [Entomortierella beljakovae]
MLPSPEHAAESGLVSATVPTTVSKPKTVKKPSKAKNSAHKISSYDSTMDIPMSNAEVDGNRSFGANEANPLSVNTSPTALRPPRSMREDIVSDRKFASDNGPRTGEALSSSASDSVPPGHRFGSGVFVRGHIPLKINLPRNSGTMSEPGTAPLTGPLTPSSASSVKTKFSRMSLPGGNSNSNSNSNGGSSSGIGRDSQSEGKADQIFQTQNSKNDPSKPTSPSFPTPPAKSKGVNKSKKASWSIGSTDADIERSNQITRSPGPAWMMPGASGSDSNGMNTSSSSSSSAQVKTDDSYNSANGSNSRRRIPPSITTTTTATTTSTDNRRLKKLKIEDKDVRQDQRSSQMMDGIVDERMKDVRYDGPSSSGKRSYTKKPKTTAGGNGLDHENGGGEGDDENEALRSARNGGNCAGAVKRHSPDGDDDGDGDGGPNTSGRRSSGQGGPYTDMNSNTNGSGGSGKGKTMKRKSNSNLSGSSTKKNKGNFNRASSDSTLVGSKESGSASGSPVEFIDIQMARPAPPRKNSKLTRKSKESGSETETEFNSSDVETDCPHLFGIDDIVGSEDEIDDGAESETKTLVCSRQASVTPTASTKLGDNPDIPDNLHKQGLEWVSRLKMSESVWEESYKTYERVKRLKELKNRQPVRKRDAILAAILLIICRDQGSPRTFSEVCMASGVKRGDIGAYYRLMIKILKPTMNSSASARDTDAEAYMTRWCESLSLTSQFRQTAIHVFSIANTLNLTSGKCPSSVGAAAIYLCIFAWNDARRIANCQKYQCSGDQCQVSPQSHPAPAQDQGLIKKEAKDVAFAVGVVSATLMGCYKNLAPVREKLIPPEFIQAAIEDM